MSKFRTIENIFRGPEPHMVGDGFRVSQYLPVGVGDIKRLSPFNSIIRLSCPTLL